MSKQEELHKSIVDDISKKYDGKLSDAQAHAAARNLIEFVKILINHHE